MMRVLVTGAGGAAGISVVSALRDAGVHTIGADPDPLAAGAHLADAQVVLPYASDDTFAKALVEAAADTGADAVICTVAEEMAAIATVAADLTGDGAAIWLPPVSAIDACLDKMRFARVAGEAGLPIPVTRAGSAVGVPGPWVVKPRHGRGSRSVHLVDDERDLPTLLRRTPDPIVQTRCRGREFTVDALVDHDGTLVGCVPRWRLETKAGISTKGATFSDPDVRALVQDTVDAFGLRGACNVQGFADSPGGHHWLLEVNPRFSGGLALSLAAGADLVGEFLRGTLGLPIRRERLSHRDGVVMTRHYREIFLEASGVEGSDR